MRPRNFVLLVLTFTPTAYSEVINFFVPSAPSPSANSFTLVLQGNVAAAIDAAATQNDPIVNPFAYVNQNFFGGVGASSITVALDAAGNTEVTFTGSNPVLPAYMFNYGTDTNGKPHFGVDGSSGTSNGGGPALNLLTDSWSNAPPLPSVSLSAPATGATVNYIIVYVDVTSNGRTVGEWLEVPYNAGAFPGVTLTNFTSSTEALSNAGYRFSDTSIPLDLLNFATEPPPGQPNSRFILFPQDDITLAPGSSAPAITPEPSTLVLVTAALLILVGHVAGVRRLSRAKRPNRTSPQ